MTDVLARQKILNMNNTGVNPLVPQGKVDIRRLEAARSKRVEQLEKWEEYDRRMRSLEKQKQPRRSDTMRERVKFQRQYELMDAALNNDLEEVSYLLKQGYDPNMCKEDGLTPLHQACINNSVEMCELLIQFGADVNRRDADQWTPLHTAAACGHVEVCGCLLVNHADILAVNVDGSIPYDIAEDEETSKFFLDEIKLRKISPADVEEARSRPEAMMVNDIIKMYNNGDDLEQLDSQGAAPIHIAAACGYQEVMVNLLRMDVNPDLLDADDWTPAHVAVSWGQLEVLELLVAYGADLTRTTPTGHDVFGLCDTEELHERVVMMWENREQLRAQVRHDGSRNASKSLKRRRSTSSVHRSSLQQKSNLSKRAVMKEVQLAQTTITTSDSANDESLGQDTPLESQKSYGGGPPRVILIDETKFRQERSSVSSDVDSVRTVDSSILRHDTKKRRVIDVPRPPTGQWMGPEYSTEYENDSEGPWSGVGGATGSLRRTKDPSERGIQVVDSRSSITSRTQHGSRNSAELLVRAEAKTNNNNNNNPASVNNPVSKRSDTGATDVLSQFSVQSSNQTNSLPTTVREQDTASTESSPYGSCCRNCIIL